MQLVRQADAAALLAHVEDAPAALGGDHLHRSVQLLAAVAAGGAEDVAREALGVHADERRRVAGEVAHEEREVLEPVRARAVHPQAEAAVARGHVHLLDALDEGLVLRAEGDEVGDGAEEEPVLRGERLDVRQARHRAVLAHDLAAEADGLQAREAHEVDRRLGVAGAADDAALARLEREHVAGAAEVLGAGAVLHDLARGEGALGGGDAGRGVLVVDRDGERGLELLGVLRDHLRESEARGPFAGHRHADQPARVRRHEVHVLGRGELGGADDVALVLAVLVVDDEDAAARTEGVEDFGDGGEHRWRGRGKGWGGGGGKRDAF